MWAPVSMLGFPLGQSSSHRAVEFARNCEKHNFSRDWELWNPTFRKKPRKMGHPSSWRCRQSAEVLHFVQDDNYFTSMTRRCGSGQTAQRTGRVLHLQTA